MVAGVQECGRIRHPDITPVDEGEPEEQEVSDCENFQFYIVESQNLPSVRSHLAKRSFSKKSAPFPERSRLMNILWSAYENI